MPTNKDNDCSLPVTLEGWRTLDSDDSTASPDISKSTVTSKENAIYLSALCLKESPCIMATVIISVAMLVGSVVMIIVWISLK
mmetsp:Transcript_10730/g.14400  ORF Transcript_10730/g.14400 Transcript_10730/m.14400 type:complete len:83 (+) Transcript_10730:60-308(+)